MYKRQDEERTSFKQQLLEITKEISNMLTNVLLWSKTQLEGTKVNLVSVDVKSVLENALSIEKKLALKKKVFS